LFISFADVKAQSAPSAKGAFFRSLLIPGWGHKYANQGEWNRGAKFHTGLEATLWAGLFGSIRSENQAIEAYEIFAASNAGVDLANRDRAFILNVANFSSDDAYRDVLLRNRAWDQLDNASGENFKWSWDSDEDRAEFRSLREHADALDRRQTFVMVSLLVQVIPVFEGDSTPRFYIGTNITF